MERRFLVLTGKINYNNNYYIGIIKSLALISEKDHLFEIENAKIFLNLLCYGAYKLQPLLRIKGMS